MSNNIIVDLKAKSDKDKQTFYVGKIKAPVMIDCSKGVVFLIFTANKNEEQLQIALMDSSIKDMDD